MQAIEFETTVDTKGNLHLPEKYHDVYGKHVRLMVLWHQTASESLPGKTVGPMKYSNALDWPVDGLDYQKQVRE
jgi:DNA-binding transcriptional regulator/RsmH inhibitor MraZ